MAKQEEEGERRAQRQKHGVRPCLSGLPCNVEMGRMRREAGVKENRKRREKGESSDDLGLKNEAMRVGENGSDASESHTLATNTDR